MVGAQRHTVTLPIGWHAVSSLRSVAARAHRRVNPIERELRRVGSLPRSQPGETTLLGAALRFVDGPSLAAQYHDIFRLGRYQLPPMPAPRILDCGANIGLASIYWKRTHPLAVITAFEADPNIAQVAQSNIETAGFSDVELVTAAVWESNGTLVFAADGADGGRAAGTGVPIAAVRLRDYLEDPVSLLKLDIEGAEAAVLVDCADSLAHVDRVFVEYHSFSGEPQRFGDVVSVLTDAGFRLMFGDTMAPQRPYVDAPETPGTMDTRLDIYGVRS